jgi:PKD repeat protein
MAQVDRISAMDEGYKTGDLSVFPAVLDSKDVLYYVSNNSSTILKQTLPYNGQTVIVEDTSGFPEQGVIRIGPSLGDTRFELIYYDKKVGNTFQNLKRGYAGSAQTYWASKLNYVTGPVAADHHNALKDAVINMETDLGISVDPTAESLNGILKQQEVRFLTPRPIFRASALKGPPPFKVRFQNFSTGHIIRFFWDFGDGTTSLEKSPNHTYVNEGTYTVTINVITSTGAQAVVKKTDYITVSTDESEPFFYVDSIDSPYSIRTAAEMSVEPKEFWFVDQSDGDIVERNWIFGDGNTSTQNDPDVHDIKHTYSEPGSYIVTLLLIFVDGRLKRVELPDALTVI